MRSRDLSHNEEVDMLTTESIFKSLGGRQFASYKNLLQDVTVVCQNNAGRLPSEIGPKDLVARAAMKHWIRQDQDGSICIVIRKSGRKKSCGPKSKAANTHHALAR